MGFRAFSSRIHSELIFYAPIAASSSSSSRFFLSFLVFQVQSIFPVLARRRGHVVQDAPKPG
jgi:hypothetical protein